MTVKELIDILNNNDPDMEVAVSVSTLLEGGVLGRVDDDMDVSVVDTFLKNDKGVREKKEILVIFGYEN